MYISHGFLSGGAAGYTWAAETRNDTNKAMLDILDYLVSGLRLLSSMEKGLKVDCFM